MCARRGYGASVEYDGSGLRRLTRTSGGVHELGDDGFPTWSPNGRHIAFSSNHSGTGGRWRDSS